jgi:Right handed beta helix region
VWAALGAAAVVVLAVAVLGLRGGGPGAEDRASGSFYVSPQGSDDAPGTRERPWRTVAAAAERLRPGDVLHLREGTYFERPEIGVSGTAAAPITIQSYPGERAVIDSGAAQFQAPGNQAWEPVDPAIGEYRSVAEQPAGNVYGYVDGVPGYVNGRVALVPYRSAEAFRATSDAWTDEETPFYVGPGLFWDPSDRRVHVRLAKTGDLRAAEARYGKVFADDLPDPRRHRIILSSAPATLTVAGAHLVIKDLTVNQAKDTILLTSDAHHVRLEGVTAWTGDTAVKADGSGIAHVTVTRSRIYGDHPRWLFWSDMKSPPAPADLMRGTAIDLYGGTHDWEISYSHLRGSGQDLIGTNTDEDRISIHHNRIENCGDDALELEGTTDVGEVRVYENYILNCLVAVAPGQDSPSFSGPLYVFRNVVAFLRDFPVNRAEGINDWNGGGRFGFEYLLKQNAGNTFIYHNTLVLLNSAGRGINLVPESPAGTYVANNLAVTVNGRVNGSPPTGPGQIVDGNLYWSMRPGEDGELLADYATVPEFAAATGLERHGLGEEPGRGTNPRFARLRLEVADPGQASWALRPASEAPRPSAFLLADNSPAIDAGIAIPRHPRLGRLPDTRSSRDIGALPHDLSPTALAGFPFDPGAAMQ